MRYKPDWPDAAERWAALWEGRSQGRPCICVTAPKGKGTPFPPARSGEQKYLDPDYVVPEALAYLESTHFGGEALPSRLLNGGWVATAYQSTPRFSPETIWFEPVKVNWEEPPRFDLDFADLWFQRYEALHKALVAAAGRDDFFIGQACVLPGNDMLARLLGTEAFMLGLLDHPDWMREAIRQLAANWLAMQQHFATLTAHTNDFWYGNGGWAHFWGPEPFLTTQSDISCMVSPEMFDEFIVPELDLVGARFGRVWYHLDGPGAERHLPRLCSLDTIRVIQWVPGAGRPPNGPAYFDLYRAIQQAGRIVHIGVPKENVEAVVRALDPGLLCIETWCSSPKESDELLADAERWTRARGT